MLGGLRGPVQGHLASVQIIFQPLRDQERRWQRRRGRPREGARLLESALGGAAVGRCHLARGTRLPRRKLERRRAGPAQRAPGEVRRVTAVRYSPARAAVEAKVGAETATGRAKSVAEDRGAVVMPSAGEKAPNGWRNTMRCSSSSTYRRRRIHQI